jgi:hypothetical protein
MAREKVREDTFKGDLPSKRRKQTQPIQTQPPKERRRYPRFKLDEHEVRCFKDNLLRILGFGRNFAKFIHDLSAVGVKMEIKKRLPVGARVFLWVNLPKYKDSFRAKGKIRWTKELKSLFGEEPHYVVGIEFLNQDEKFVRKIERMRSWFTSQDYERKKRISETRFLKKNS